MYTNLISRTLFIKKKVQNDTPVLMSRYTTATHTLFYRLHVQF